MPVINPYLNFNGKTEEAFNFYKSVFGGEFLGGMMRFKDMPGAENMSPEDANKIMHVALPIGNNLLMATDALESMGQKLTFGNNAHVCVDATSLDEAKKLFNGLSAGGTIEMPLEKASWGAYFGAFRDKFNVQWMIVFDEKNAK